MGQSLESKSEKNGRRHTMVTGAAGYVGRAVARELIHRGDSIIGLYHQKLPEALDRMMPLCADLRTPESILAPLRSVETVIHLAWEGGVLGSPALRGLDLGRQRLEQVGNALMTAHVVRAMERQNVRRIVFLSWLGAADSSARMVQREKYWAENIILNSKIPEKIIIRCGVIVDPDEKTSEFAQATQRLSKIPLITPLPRTGQDIVLTSKAQLVAKIVDLARAKALDPGVYLQEIASAGPITGAEALATCSARWWGQRKIPMDGILGRRIFQLIDCEFGRLAEGSPKMSDYLAISKASDMVTRSAIPTEAKLELGGVV